MIAYKLFRVRRDGSLGSLFINKSAILPMNKWIVAEDHKTKGYKHRPGCYIDVPIDEAIRRYLSDKLYCQEGMTKELLIKNGWVTAFCVEDNAFWAYDAQEC